MIRKLDIYILRKFLGTFFFSIIIIMLIVVVFDISEKIGDFMDKKAPIHAIVFDYYLNFIPYFANMLSPLFVFIAVIFFTSRMAAKSEIIAILASGVSFKRLLVPYMAGAFILSMISLYMNHSVIPYANKKRQRFEERYYWERTLSYDQNIHRQTGPGTFVYMWKYDYPNKTAYMFSMEKISNGNRYWYLKADQAVWDSLHNKWTIENYFIRKLNGMNEEIRTGARMDTTISNLEIKDLAIRMERMEAMSTPELTAFITEQKNKGTKKIEFYEVEKFKRTSLPFATFVLTLIGAIVASRKVRGGTGLHIAFGLLLCFSYIFFMQVANTFATSGSIAASIAVWIPNVLFLGIALLLLRYAPK